MLGSGNWKRGLALLGIFNLNHQPIRLLEPLDSRQRLTRTAAQIKIHLVLAAFDLIHNYFLGNEKDVGKQVQVGIDLETMRLQSLSAAYVGKQNPSGAVGNQNRLLKQVQQIRQQA